jgi:hypothetical protein
MSEKCIRRSDEASKRLVVRNMRHISDNLPKPPGNCALSLFSQERLAQVLAGLLPQRDQILSRNNGYRHIPPTVIRIEERYTAQSLDGQEH